MTLQIAQFPAISLRAYSLEKIYFSPQILKDIVDELLKNSRC